MRSSYYLIHSFSFCILSFLVLLVTCVCCTLTSSHLARRLQRLSLPLLEGVCLSCSFGRNISSSTSPSSRLKLGPEQLGTTLDWMFFRSSFPIKIENVPVQADAIGLSGILVSGRSSHTNSGIMVLLFNR